MVEVGVELVVGVGKVESMFVERCVEGNVDNLLVDAFVRE